MRGEREKENVWEEVKASKGGEPGRDLRRVIWCKGEGEEKTGLMDG